MKKRLSPESKEFKNLVDILINKKISLPSLYTYLEKLNKNELLLLALELDLPSLINFCKSSKRINEKVCKNNEIWIYRLKEDFGIVFNNIYSLQPKKLYILLYKVKEEFVFIRSLGRVNLYDLLYSSRYGLLWHSLPNDDKDRRKMDYIISFLNDKKINPYDSEDDSNEELDEDPSLEDYWFKNRERFMAYLPFHKKGVTVTLDDIDEFWDNSGELITKIQEKSEYKLIKGIKKQLPIISEISDKEIQSILSLNELIKNSVFSITMNLHDLALLFHKK